MDNRKINPVFFIVLLCSLLLFACSTNNNNNSSSDSLTFTSKSDSTPSTITNGLPDSFSSTSKSTVSNAQAVGYGQIYDAKSDIDESAGLAAYRLMIADAIMQSDATADGEKYSMAIELTQEIVNAIDATLPDSMDSGLSSSIGDKYEFSYQWSAGSGDFAGGQEFALYEEDSSTATSKLYWNNDFSKVKIIDVSDYGTTIMTYDATTDAAGPTSLLNCITDNGVYSVMLKSDSSSSDNGVWIKYKYYGSSEVDINAETVTSYSVYQMDGYADDNGGYSIVSNTASLEDEAPDAYGIVEAFDANGTCVYSAYTHDDSAVTVPSTEYNQGLSFNYDDTLPNDWSSVSGTYSSYKTQAESLPSTMSGAFDMAETELGDYGDTTCYGVTLTGATAGESYLIYKGTALDTSTKAILNTPSDSDYDLTWESFWSDQLVGVAISDSADSVNVYQWISTNYATSANGNLLEDVSDVTGDAISITLP